VANVAVTVKELSIELIPVVVVLDTPVQMIFPFSSVGISYWLFCPQLKKRTTATRV